MRIHSDTLSTRDLFHALDEVATHTGSAVDLLKAEKYSSRKRARALEVQLSSDGRLTHCRTMSDRNAYAATWDQWGWFIAHLYSVDRDAIVGPYADFQDFHRQTSYKFTAPTATTATH
jgi:hypothetical protein